MNKLVSSSRPLEHDLIIIYCFEVSSNHVSTYGVNTVDADAVRMEQIKQKKKLTKKDFILM